MSTHRPSREVPQRDDHYVFLKDSPLPVLSQREVAEIMTARGYPMTASAVGQTEKRALRKIAEHPLMQDLWEEISAYEPPSQGDK